MTNAAFNKLWDRLHKYNRVNFTDHGEKMTLSLSANRYGSDAVLTVVNGNLINTVTAHWNKEHFRRILVD